MVMLAILALLWTRISAKMLGPRSANGHIRRSSGHFEGSRAMNARLIPMREPHNQLQAGAHCSDGWDVATPWHYHDMHQLLYAFDGAVEVEGWHGSYKVPSQYAAWIPAGAVHRTTIQKVGSGSIFLSTDMISSPCDVPRVISALPLLREMVLYAMRWPLERSSDPTSESYFQCFARLCQDWIGSEVKLVLPSSADARIASIMAHTRARLASATLEGVCRSVGMSERTLRRQFRNATGITWEDYRMRLRMCVALDAIEKTSASIGSIAADVGYDNQAAFARAFRSVIGVSPSEYRRQN